MPGFELFGEEEKKEVQDVLDNGVLMRYGFDGNRNGHYKASAGIGSGDEVIMPTFTFVATFEAILSVGAIPILCDIDDTLTLNPKAVRELITDKTKAIMPVHMCGSMADLDALKQICQEHQLVLIEDACQAIGGSYHGKPLGSYGDLGCFSFDYVKTVTAGEGGALITNNETYAKIADKYQDHGHDHIGNDRGAEKHPFLGYNYRLSELNAAVGIAQLRKLDSTIEVQKKNYAILREALSKIPEVTFRRVPEGGIESYAFLNIFLPTEEITRAVHQSLGANGVDVCFYWFDNNWHYYRKWEHLIEQQSVHKLSNEIKEGLSKNIRDFSSSDVWISRTISCLIKVGWSENQTNTRASKMVQAIQDVLKTK